MGGRREAGPRPSTCRRPILLACTALVAGAGAAPAAGTGRDARLAAALRAVLRPAQAVPGLAPTRVATAFADLDGDGTEEAVVHVTGGGWCGSGGCLTLVLQQRGEGFRKVAAVTLTRLPVRLLPQTSHGWHAIGVRVGGGGLRRAGEAALFFDGRRYPGNPTVPPARALSGPAGRVLIGDDAPAEPL